MKKCVLRPLENNLDLFWYFSMKWGELPQRFNKVSPPTETISLYLLMGGELRVPPTPAPLELEYHSFAPAHEEVEGNSTPRFETDKGRALIRHFKGMHFRTFSLDLFRV